MNLTLILLCTCGLLMHFLGRYGEACRASRISPLAYIAQDIPGWLSAIIGSVVCMAILPDLPVVLGIPASPELAGSGLLKLLALTAGYMGSSLAAKVPALVTGRGTR